MWDFGVKAWCLQLNTTQPCLSPRSAALHVVKPWLVPAVTYLTCANQHRPNSQPCQGTIVCTSHKVLCNNWADANLYLGPDEAYLADLLELQPSIRAGTKTCQDGALPKLPPGNSKHRARQQVPGPNGIYWAWYPVQHLSLVALFTMPKKSWQHGEAAPQVNWNTQLAGPRNLPTASQIK